MALHYMSGEIIHNGDQICYANGPGEVEFVVDHGAVEEATAWYLNEHGPGCMIKTLRSGSIFLHAPEEEEDLEFPRPSVDVEKDSSCRLEMPMRSATRHVVVRCSPTYHGQWPSGVQMYAIKLARSLCSERPLYQKTLESATTILTCLAIFGPAEA